MNELRHFVSQDLSSLRSQGLYNTIRTIDGPQGSWIIVDGKKALNLSNNNYLGFANHPRLKEAAVKAISRYGVGPGAVRSIAGTQTIHKEFEEKVARFKGVESAILFQSGFCANLAVIPAVVGEDDIIFSDELNHASIIDGCRLSKAKVVRYAHNNPSSLKEKLTEYKDFECKKLVVTDGVFSMDGDIAPLPEIFRVSHEFGAITMVDDAHGEGVLGEHGEGICHHYGVTADIEVGTLSKAFGVMGGYVAGSSALKEWLSQRARPFLFSSALTPGDVGACIEAISILEEDDTPIRKLWDNARFFKEKMKSLGFDTGISQTPITPVMIGEADKASTFSRMLFDEGVFAQSLGYPTVPKGKARIRVMISAVHEKEDLEFGIEVFRKIGEKLGVIS
jgi:glycine C-acetyltransferase